MAAALACAALLLFDRWRRDGSMVAGWCVPPVFLLALLSSEFAVSALGYFIAHSLCLDRGKPSRRLTASLAYFAPTSVWFGLYLIGNYGTRGSGAYISPLEEPLAGGLAVLLRMPWLLNGTFGIGTADLHALAPTADRAQWSFLAWLVAAGILALLFPVIQRNRASRFWVAGLLFSSGLLCTSPPRNRLLVLLALSGAALVDLLVSELVAGLGRRLWRCAAATLAVLWLVVHGAVSPALRLASAHALVAPNQWLKVATDTACEGVNDDQQLIVMQAPNYYLGSLMASVGHANGCQAKRHRVLYGGAEAPIIRRLNERTLSVHTDFGFLQGPVDRVYRGASRRYHVGQGLQLSGVLILVKGVTENGDPKDVEFQFGWPLEDHRFHFVAWNGERYAPLEIPPVGKKVKLKGFATPPSVERVERRRPHQRRMKAMTPTTACPMKTKPKPQNLDR